MTIEFGRGKDKQKRKQRRKEIFGAIREAGRKDARAGEGAYRQKQALEASLRGNAAYAAGRADVAVNRAKKKYGEMKESLGARGAAALGKAKDFMGKAKSAAGELTGKARSAVASGYAAVKEKASKLRRMKNRGESYARAIEALEFEVAKQVGILEFASGRNYIEFARTPGARDKSKRRRRIMQGAAAVGGAAALALAAKNPQAVKKGIDMGVNLAERASSGVNKGVRRGIGMAAGMSEKAGIAGRKALRRGYAQASAAGTSLRERASRAKSWVGSKMPKRKAD